MDRKMFTTDFATAPSTRAHSMKLDSTSKYRPKPVLSLRSSTASLDQENIKPSNESSTHALSASSECPLRRTTEMPFPKPARSLSVSDGLVADRRTACEDDIALKLETVPGHSPKAIHAHQLAELLRNTGQGSLFDLVMILDARFNYEHEGGHIIGAHNVYLSAHFEDLKEKLTNVRSGDRVCVVIHCEFSSHRGPKLFRMLRAWDRELNVYPNLHFPEMYILQGGYKEFYSKFPEWCTRGYVPMHHRDFSDQCTEAMKLTRSQSSTKIKRSARSDAESASPLFGVRNEESVCSAADTVCSANRVVISSNGKQESIFNLSMSSIPSLSETSTISFATTDRTLDTCSDTSDDDSACPFDGPTSPASRRAHAKRSMFQSSGLSRDFIVSRVSAPPRAQSLQALPIRGCSQSTSDLPRWTEDDEEDPTRSYTSRS